MKEEEARILMEDTNADYTQKQRILRGLNIIAKYDDNINFVFEHDQLFVSIFQATIEQMTEEEIIEMAVLGWFQSDYQWSHM